MEAMSSSLGEGSRGGREGVAEMATRWRSGRTVAKVTFTKDVAKQSGDVLARRARRLLLCRARRFAPALVVLGLHDAGGIAH